MPDATRIGAKCVKCNHAWVVLYLPQNLTLAAKIMKSMSRYCPKCGTGGPKLARDAELPKETE